MTCVLCSCALVTIPERLSMRASHSQEYFQKAKQVMVGGVNNPIRTFEGVGGKPLVIKYGRGAKLHDLESLRGTQLRRGGESAQRGPGRSATEVSYRVLINGSLD